MDNGRAMSPVKRKECSRDGKKKENERASQRDGEYEGRLVE